VLFLWDLEFFFKKTGAVKRYANSVNEMTSSWATELSRAEYEAEPEQTVDTNNYEFIVDKLAVQSYAGIDFIEDQLVFVDGEERWS
jgi:hypothetical protein